MAKRRALLDELTGGPLRGTDALFRNVAVDVANRVTRRGFLSVVGRATFATLGGSFLSVLVYQESALANHCFSSPPESCLCKDLQATGFNNKCRANDCQGGNWLTCCNGTNCPKCTSGGQRTYRRYNDCCSQCGDGCRSVECPPGSNHFGDVCCNSEPSPSVYCNNCHGNCPGNQDTVHCVRTTCTSIAC